MTQPTSSSSAGGTTEDSKPGPIGRQHTGMTSAATSDRMTDWDFRVWSAKVALRHWLLGKHTLIPTEEWTYDDGVPHVEYIGMKCWRCEYSEDA